MLREKYEYQFPRFSTYDGFSRILPRINFPGFSHSMGFPVIYRAMGNWWENPCISHMMKYTTGLESNRKTTHFMEKALEPISQAFPIRWVSLTFVILWEVWWENTCISHVMKYTTKWESNGKKALILSEKLEHQFPRLFPYHGFCCIFPCCRKLMRKSMHPHMMTLINFFQCKYFSLTHSLARYLDS